MESKLRRAVPGALPAPCEVCGDHTLGRVKIGDGFAAVCSKSCLRAWPRTLERIRERDELVELLRESQDILDTAYRRNLAELTMADWKDLDCRLRSALEGR